MDSKLESEILHPHEWFSIVGLEFKPNEVAVEVASWEEPTNKGRLLFTASKLLSIEVAYFEEDLKEEPDLLDFPWDYYGFSSNQLDNSRWEFILASHVLEIVFEAEWPSFSKI